MANNVEAPPVLALGESDGVACGIPYRYLTRHGIIAGSTGTGKSRAMQVLAEQLANSGVHVFVSDVKGDASGFCEPAFIQNDKEPSETEKKWNERNSLAPFEPQAFGANYWSASDRFIPFRFSISSVGSVLFSRLLSLNPTQESHLAIAFSYAKKSDIPLDTPEQLLDVLDQLVSTNQRGISPSSISVIQRKIIALQESGLERMFGKPSVRLEDLGGLNVLNLSDARSDMAVTISPAFLLQKLFSQLPEVGDVDKPRFVIFFDEAHYLFKDANKSLRDLMVTMLKQIRSKGVSIFFVTQDVTDIPDEILGQLSTKIIFSQKPMTEKGNARLKALAKSFPKAGFDIMEALKSLPPGTALLSTLADGGNQTVPVQVKVFAPATTMSVVPDDALRNACDPALLKKYAKRDAAPKAAPISKPQPAASPKPETLQQPPRSVPKPETRQKPVPAQKVLPVRVKEVVKEVIVEKKVVKKAGPSILDALLGGLLKLLQFILKAAGMVVGALIAKPLKSFYKYLVKKPVRVLYFLLLLLLLYVLFVNWALIQSLLGTLKLS
ncbi:MAG: helicase HerA-like domain-containing protein [Candidatus Micrarchaeota archaeon]